VIEKKDTFRKKLHDLIFEADTRTGKVFDVVLLFLILISVAAVILETVESMDTRFHTYFVGIEWTVTILFTIEYFLRILSVKKPLNYIFSFYGIIDLLAILPSYLSLFFIGTRSFAIIRTIRLLRVFRIFKLGPYLNQGRIITQSIKKSIPKITVFLYFVVLIVFLFGSVMYVIEGDVNERFDSIPRSIYWAIVTLTTVGYGDIAPITSTGQFLASIVMIMGYALIAVPTGIISAEMVKHKSPDKITTQSCPHCLKEGHDPDAVFCKHCGEDLN